MIKRIVKYILLVVVVFILTFFCHDYFLLNNEMYLPFSLVKVYLFNAIASACIYIAVEFVAEKLPSQAGYAFLASVFLKIGLFVMLFQGTVFAQEALPMFARISLIIPFFLFIIIEAVSIAKLLNAKTF